MGVSAYERLADLPLHIDAVDLAFHRREVSSDFERRTTEFALRGDGETGRGEDVTYEAEEHERLEADPPAFPFAGGYTLAEFSARLDDVDLFPHGAPDREVFRHYRRWGVESAALDLALRQAATSLDEALGRSYDPVRFVVSTKLGEPPTTDRVEAWRAIDPDLAFKLDVNEEWTADLVEALAALGGIRIFDCKGQYEGTDVDTETDPALLRELLAAFPEAVIEDPEVTAATEPILAEATDRLSWDAPIEAVDDIRDRPWPPDWINIKPSRFGSLEALLEAIAYCETNDIAMYGGGQFELSVGRGQLHALASLFYPDAPNDVAPGGYNAPAPQAGLPSSPLAPPETPRGFRWPR